MASSKPAYRQIRALYNDETITVYQAYKASIAEAAVATQKLNASPDFRPGRMTWIKPSWCWMMYRAGYSFKDPGQERILALKMRHQDFIGLLERGVLTTHGPGSSNQVIDGRRQKTSDVKIQWDPERSPRLDVLPYRSIQIGIPGALSDTWAKEWIAEIEDVTEKARKLKKTLDEDASIPTERLVELNLVPEERPFTIPENIQTKLQMGTPSRPNQ